MISRAIKVPFAILAVLCVALMEVLLTFGGGLVLIMALCLAFSGCSKVPANELPIVQAEPVLAAEPLVPDYVKAALDEFRTETREWVAMSNATMQEEQDAELHTQLNEFSHRLKAIETAVESLQEQQLATAGLVAELALKKEPVEPIPMRGVVEELEPATQVGGEAPPERDAVRSEPAVLMLQFGDESVSVQDFIAKWYRSNSGFHAPKREDLREHLAREHKVGGDGFNQLDEETLRKLHIAIHERSVAMKAPQASGQFYQSRSSGTVKRGPFGRVRFK